MVTDGAFHKQRAPREEPEPPPPFQKQAAVDEVFDDEPIMWRAMCKALQVLVVHYFNIHAGRCRVFRCERDGKVNQ